MVAVILTDKLKTLIREATQARWRANEAWVKQDESRKKLGDRYDMRTKLAKLHQANWVAYIAAQNDANIANNAIADYMLGCVNGGNCD